jgi:hypothetical protein
MLPSRMFVLGINAQTGGSEQLSATGRYTLPEKQAVRNAPCPKTVHAAVGSNGSSKDYFERPAGPCASIGIRKTVRPAIGRPFASVGVCTTT